MFANSSWGNAATAFSLSSQFYVCGRTCHKLYIAESVASWEKESGSVVKLCMGLQYPVWLLRNTDSNINKRALSQ